MAPTSSEPVIVARRRRSGWRMPRRAWRPARRGLWRLLTILCLVGMVLGPRPLWQPTAAVAAAPPVDPTAPPDLLGAVFLGDPLYAATDPQKAAIRELEQAAIANVIKNYKLKVGSVNTPGGPAAVPAPEIPSWGRSEALAELFLLIVLAIKTPVPQRTVAQQAVVTWMTAVQQRQNQRSAVATGAEYVKWAGLNETAYNQLIASNPSTAQLEDFLNDDLYSGSATGFCEYHPPAPFDTTEEYNGRSVQQCFTNCTNPLGCDPPTPSYDQFVKWGAARTNARNAANPDFGQAATTIGTAVAVAVGSSVATSAAFTTAAALVTLEGATTLVGALFPFAWSISSAAIVSLAAGFVAIILAAIVIAILQGIEVFNAAALPGQFANLISASNTAPDLNAILTTDGGIQGLFLLFVGASLPTPRAESCLNAPPPVPYFPLDPYTSGWLWTPCLNAPPIPAPDNNDPYFVVTREGAAPSPPSRTLTWRDASLDTTPQTTDDSIFTARLHDTWFVTQVNGVDTKQALSLHYTDWEAKGQNTWLIGDPTNGYKFLGFVDSTSTSQRFSPSTCISENICFYSPTIKFIGADGLKYTATVVPPPQTTFTSITHSPENPVSGQPVTFQATATSPSNLPITYSWSFQRHPDDCPTVAPCYTTVTGNPVVYSPIAGRVEVTATDTSGATNTTSYPFSLRYPAEVTWATPAPITYGTPLSATQLNAVGGNPNSIIIGTGLPYLIPGSFTYSFNRQPIGPGTVLPAGNNVIRAHFTPDDLTAHAPSTKDVTLVVNKAPLTLTANDQTMTYGAAIPALDVRYNGLVNGDTGAAVHGLTCFALNALNGPVSAPPVGSYRIACSGASAANYTIAYADGTLTVDRAPLTIAARDQQMVLRGAVPPLAADYRGLVNGDTPAALTTAPTCTTTATSASAAGSYPITCTGAAAANYTITYSPGTLRVVYQFGGFPAPLGGGPTPSFKAGGTVVVAFQLKDATGAPIQATTPPTFSASPPVPCAAGAVDPGTSVAGGPGTPYRWDGAARQYIYSYKVANSFAGSCQFLRATFDDGTAQSVFVAYTK